MIPQIKVVSIRTHPPSRCDIDCTRKGSPLSNPYTYVPTAQTAECHIVCNHQEEVDKFNQWFATQRYSSKVWKEIRSLAGRARNDGIMYLLCWCPEYLPCHARTIKTAIEEYLEGKHQVVKKQRKQKKQKNKIKEKVTLQKRKVG